MEKDAPQDSISFYFQYNIDMPKQKSLKSCVIAERTFYTVILSCIHRVRHKRINGLLDSLENQKYLLNYLIVLPDTISNLEV